jgi:assimilatory nitrate reductase catalytic subunit
VEPKVCSCLNVSEAEIRAAIADGARSVEAVGKACEAGTGCQTCHPAIRNMLAERARADLRAGRAPGLAQLSLFGASGRKGGGRPNGAG